MKPSPGPWNWKDGELVDANRETLLVLDADVDYPIPGGHEGTTSEPPREVLALTALAPEMREMLLKIELWSEDCPDCGEILQAPDGGLYAHGVGCGFGALLEKLR